MVSQKLRATAAEPVCTIATGCPYSTIQPLTAKTFTSLDLDVRRGPGWYLLVAHVQSSAPLGRVFSYLSLTPLVGQ